MLSTLNNKLMAVCILLCLFIVKEGYAKTISLPLSRISIPANISEGASEIVSEQEAKRRGLAIEKAMENYFNVQYYSTLYIGDGKDAMTFMFDTGSDYLWVPLDNCTDCHTTNLYTPTDSFKTEDERDGIFYASGEVSGVIATDLVSATSDGESVQLQLLGVDTEGSDLSNLVSDGILGMTPSSSGNAEIFVTQLYLQGVIDDNVFGVDYRDRSEQSKIILGGYDESVVTNFDDLTFVPLRDDSYWSLDLIQTLYGSEEIEMNAVRGILDTGTSLTYFDVSDWDQLYAKLSFGRATCGYSNVSGLRACTCTSPSEFEDITFQFCEYKYTFPSSSWVKLESPGVCVFYVDSIDLGFSTVSVLLGDVFLRNYYVYHDVTNFRVGFYGESTHVPDTECTIYTPGDNEVDVPIGTTNDDGESSSNQLLLNNHTFLVVLCLAYITFINL